MEKSLRLRCIGDDFGSVPESCGLTYTVYYLYWLKKCRNKISSSDLELTLKITLLGLLKAAILCKYDRPCKRHYMPLYMRKESGTDQLNRSL